MNRSLKNLAISILLVIPLIFLQSGGVKRRKASGNNSSHDFHLRHSVNIDERLDMKQNATIGHKINSPGANEDMEQDTSINTDENVEDEKVGIKQDVGIDINHNNMSIETKQYVYDDGQNDGILESSGTIIVENNEQDVSTNFNANDRTKSIIAARLGIMEVSPNIVDEMKKVNISIVVSHCEENVGWIAEYIGDQYSIKDITIYSKCGKEIEGLQPLEHLSPTINVLTLPNVGRCDHTYAHWIKEQYKPIGEERNNENDIVMFLKDRDHWRGMYLPIDLLFTHVSKSGFGCVTKPLCNCNPECSIDNESLLMPMMQHGREFLLDNFFLDHYTREGKTDDCSQFLSEQYNSLKEWKEEIGFIIPESETVPVCYGGLFAAQKKQFFNQPEESWERMEASLSRADNIIEGHYAERLWASILSDIDIESAKAVDEVLSPHIAMMMIKRKEWCAMKGMVYVHRDDKITIP